VLDRLTTAANDLEECISLKGKIVESRLQKQQDLISTHNASREFRAQEKADSEALQEQREELVLLNSELRKAYNITSAESIEGARLKAIEESE
jgi:hypothetical protein